MEFVRFCWYYLTLKENMNTNTYDQNSELPLIKSNGWFSFSGRIPRGKFLGRIAAVHLNYLACILIAYYGVAPSDNDIFKITAFGVLLVLILQSAVVLFSSLTLRFHDLGLSAWYLILAFIPIVYLFVVAYLLFKPGNGESNKYGSSPLA